jgi:hypothetical protein
VGQAKLPNSHGRFIEMAVRHVPKLFSTAVATPFFTKEDQALN